VKRHSPEPKKSEPVVSTKVARLDDEKIEKGPEPDLENRSRFAKFNHGVNESKDRRVLSILGVIYAHICVA